MTHSPSLANSRPTSKVRDLMARAFAGGRVPSASNPTPSRAQNAGTLGGPTTGRPGRPQLMLGDEKYLWILVILEVLATGVLRKKFRRHHGG